MITIFRHASSFRVYSLSASICQAAFTFNDCSSWLRFESYFRGVSLRFPFSVREDSVCASTFQLVHPICPLFHGATLLID
ncbi:hypothetical protein F5051DRAFT_421139, partial [Lentinula edodes]